MVFIMQKLSERLITTVHQMHKLTTPHERLLALGLIGI